MFVTQNNDSKEPTIYMSKEFLQDEGQNDWCSYKPIVDCIITERFPNAYIKNNKIYSDEEYPAKFCITYAKDSGEDGFLIKNPITLHRFDNIGNYYKKSNWGNNDNGEYISTPLYPKNIKMIKFTLNDISAVSANSGILYLFGCEYEEKYFNIGINADGQLGIGLGNSSFDEDAIDFKINDYSDKEWKILITKDNPDDSNELTLSIYIDNELIHSKTNSGSIPDNRKVCIFNNNTKNGISDYQTLGFGKKLILTDKEKYKHIHELKYNVYDSGSITESSNDIFYPDLFDVIKIRSLLAGENSTFNSVSAKYSKVETIQRKIITIKDEDNNDVDIEVFNYVFDKISKFGRKLQFELIMEKSNTLDTSKDPVEYINNIEVFDLVFKMWYAIEIKSIKDDKFVQFLSFSTNDFKIKNLVNSYIIDSYFQLNSFSTSLLVY